MCNDLRMWVSVLALTAGAAQPALAQTSSDPGTSLEEVVVTAQRRSQNLQDVPISVSAVSGKVLAEGGFKDPRDLQTFVPNLQFRSATAASTTSIFIRGVGISDFNSNTTGAVGVYVDDVFLGANAGKLFNVFDGAGIEVLRGPQGTLYGRNTTGGAIKFTSKLPTEDITGDLSASYGRFNEQRLDAGIGGALIPGLLKARVSGFSLKRDGTVLNRTTGNRVNDLDSKAGRAIIDLTPGGGWLVRLSAHIGENNGGARQFAFRGHLDGGTDLTGYSDNDGNPYRGDYNIEGRETIKAKGASLRIENQSDLGTFTAISAYEEVKRRTLEDTDAAPTNSLSALYIDRPRQISQELRFQSPTDKRFSWNVGGFYFHDILSTNSQYDVLRDFRDPTAPLNGFDPANSIGVQRFPYTQVTDSLAGFSQADFKITDKLIATAGLRYTHDKIDFRYASFFDEDGFIVPIVATDATKSFNDTSYRLGVNYKTDNGSLLYATVSSGYNSGGFSGGAATDAAQLQPYRPESLTAYEAGFKTELLDRRLRWNSSVFAYRYQDLQVFILDLSGVIPIQRKTNAGSARIYGLETEVTARLMEGLDLFLAGGVTHSEYRGFMDGTADYSGNQLIGAPKATASGGLSYRREIESLGTLTARLDGSYQTRVFFTAANEKDYSQKAYGTLNARVGLTLADDRTEVALWVKNLTAERYLTDISPVIAADELNYNDPRTYGVQISYHF